MKCNILLCFRLGYPLFHRILTEDQPKSLLKSCTCFPTSPLFPEKREHKHEHLTDTTVTPHPFPFAQRGSHIGVNNNHMITNVTEEIIPISFWTMPATFKKVYKRKMILTNSDNRVVQFLMQFLLSAIF